MRYDGAQQFEADKTGQQGERAAEGGVDQAMPGHGGFRQAGEGNQEDHKGSDGRRENHGIRLLKSVAEEAEDSDERDQDKVLGLEQMGDDSGSDDSSQGTNDALYSVRISPVKVGLQNNKCGHRQPVTIL